MYALTFYSDVDGPLWHTFPIILLTCFQLVTDCLRKQVHDHRALYGLQNTAYVRGQSVIFLLYI